jgi:hypothetical protein
MLSLNDKSNAIFMQFVDRLAGDKRLRIKREAESYLILELLETDIAINSRNSIGNLYSLVMSNTQNATKIDPGMRFIVVDNRTGQTDADAIAIYPVSYRQDEIRTYEEAVEIINHKVFSINKALQKKHCHFANLWLKKIEAKGYLKEFLQKAEGSDPLFCVCGNTHHLDGFVHCNEFGNEIEMPSIEPGYLLCRSCKRIIDTATLEVVATKDQGNGSGIATQKLNINQSLIEMSYAEKAKLLHILCPEVIRGFITYVLEAAVTMINNPDMGKMHSDNEKISAEGWVELAQVVRKKISDSFEDLVGNSNFFAVQLFDGHSLNFLMDCLQEYVSKCQNERFNKGVEFIFDL